MAPQFDSDGHLRSWGRGNIMWVVGRCVVLSLRTQRRRTAIPVKLSLEYCQANEARGNSSNRRRSELAVRRRLRQSNLTLEQKVVLKL